MEDVVKKIVTKFREYDPLWYGNNKQNYYKNQKDERNQSDDSEKPHKRIQRLEAMIDSLVTEANSVFRFYQEALREAADKQEQLRQEICLVKATLEQEKKEAEAQVTEMSKKIEELNEEVNLKSIQFHDLLEKYEDFEEDSSQIRTENEDKIKVIKESMSKERNERDLKIELLEEQLANTRQTLLEEIKIREEVLFENCELKSINNDLKLSIQIIRKQMHSQESKKTKRAWSPEKEDRLEECEIISRERYQDEPFTFEEVRMNESQEILTHTAKEVLDLSEHYSKFNRTEEFLSKQKPSSILDMNSNESKPLRSSKLIQKTVNRRVQCNNSVYLQIATIQSRDEVIHLQSLKSKNTQEIKQFHMPSGNESELEVDPYRAFFSLMVQCQKMNSANFNRICDQNLNYLYDYFLQECIPYNEWQRQIRKRLKQTAPTYRS